MMTRAGIVEVKFTKRINYKPEKVFRLRKASGVRFVLSFAAKNWGFSAKPNCGIIRPTIGLTDNQLATVMGMARTVPVEKCDLYLQRIAAMRWLRRAA